MSKILDTHQPIAEHIHLFSQLCWALPKYEEPNGQEKALYRDRETYNKLFRRGTRGLYYARSGTDWMERPGLR
jgi:hypothetical protein